MAQLRMDGRPAARRPRLSRSIWRFLALLAIVLSIIVSVSSLNSCPPDPMIAPLLGP